MTIGLGLIKKLLDTKELLTDLKDKGVDDDSFVGEELKVYKFLKRHLAEYGVYPKEETIDAEVNVSLPELTDEPIEYWIDRVERRRMSRLITEAAEQMMEACSEGDVDVARGKLRDCFLELEARSPTHRVDDLVRKAQLVLIKHDRLRNSGEMDGVPFGLDYLDQVSNGAQPGDTIAIVGRPGMGKSYFEFAMANYAYDAGKCPLVVTLEMPALQCARRIMALRTRVPTDLIRKGRLGHWGRMRLEEGVGNLMGNTDRPFWLLEGELKSTIEDLVLTVRELKPDALYVDGAYLLRSKENISARWERVSQTAEFLKMIATEFSIPAIATYQFNRRGAGKLENIAYTDAVGQLASIVISLDEDLTEERERESGVWKARTFKILELLKGREGERGKIQVLYDMSRMLIEQTEVLSGYR